jgi:hypothetical protein
MMMLLFSVLLLGALSAAAVDVPQGYDLRKLHRAKQQVTVTVAQPHIVSVIHTHLQPQAVVYVHQTDINGISGPADAPPVVKTEIKFVTQYVHVKRADIDSKKDTNDSDDNKRKEAAL